MGTLWDRTLAVLEQTLPSNDYAAWITSLRPSTEDESLTVEAPSAFHRNWVRDHFLERIEKTVHSVAGRRIPISLAVAPAGAPPSAPPPDDDPPVPRPLRMPARRDALHTETLTFESFVVGACNALAHRACVGAAEAPGRKFNPLFIHGGVGLGKTHLLHAVANAARARFRGARVLAIGAEFFLSEMVTALKRQQMENFHYRFRRVDMLLVDDVQFIAGKERTQEEFLHTFNRLCSAGKQIVVTSDRPPAAIPRLEDGLRSRFEGGMIAEVQQPDLDTRRRILEHKAAAAGIELPAAVTSYLAERIRALSVRELEGTLTRLRAMASLWERPIDLDLAREAVGPMYPGPRERPSADHVESLVGQALAIEPRLLLSTQRSQRVVFARQIAMYFLRKMIGLSLSAIGERYDRDHTTVLHAVRTIDTRRRCDPEVRRLVMLLEEKM